jgi:hypothetical protein
MDEIKVFENTKVEIITDNNGEPLFELYSTGMALGQVKKNSKGIENKPPRYLPRETCAV